MKEFFIYDKNQEEKVPFSKELTIGRSPKCGLTLNEKEVSTNHARISVSSDGVFIEDFNSFNGTFLNGARLEPKEKRTLQVKDIIQIGNHLLFFNSVEGNVEYVDLPSFTGSFKIANVDEKIIHDKFEEINNDIENKNKYSLKGLRSNKEKINEIRKHITDLNGLIKDRETVRSVIDEKKSELNEFDNYFRMKKYKTEEDILKTISSVDMVNQKIGDEIKAVECSISELQAEINSLNQKISKLQNQAKESQKEFDHNRDVREELYADLEIFRGRGGLVDEIKTYMQRLKKFEDFEMEKQMEKLKDTLVKEEESLKEAQKKYAQNKFGSDGLFKKKAS